MTRFSATDAANGFDLMLELAQSEPVHITNDGRDVGVLMSVQQYDELLGCATAINVGPCVEVMLERSIRRRRSLYQALARRHR